VNVVTNFTAIFAMGLLAYAGLAVLPEWSDLAVVAAFVVTGVCGAIGWFLWQGQEPSPLSPRQWALMLFGSWGFAVVIFLVNALLSGISPMEALRHPASLRQGILFWDAIFFGPGATLIAIGSVIRLALLRRAEHL
jgi:hypothetical protein